MRSFLSAGRSFVFLHFSKSCPRRQFHRGSLASLAHQTAPVSVPPLLTVTECLQSSIKRYKYKKPAKLDAANEEESDDENEDSSDKSYKSITGHMSSLRADGVLKAGLGLSRNKVEAAFYESRIRVNGAKIPKKSYKVSVGDEVDLIKEKSALNEDFLNISRVEVISARENEDGDGLVVKMKRFKSLTIDDYSQDPYSK